MSEWSWTAPTLLGALSGLSAERWARSRLPDADHVTANPSARCDECGRTTAADMLTDLRGLGPIVRARLGVGPTVEYACDACRERWIRDDRIGRETLLRALGAPAVGEYAHRLRGFIDRKGDR